MKRKNKRKLTAVVFGALFLVLIIWTAWVNTALELNEYIVIS
jgi:hypothetical protein